MVVIVRWHTRSCKRGNAEQKKEQSQKLLFADTTASLHMDGLILPLEILEEVFTYLECKHLCNATR
jgi:hypothetical protein